MRGSLVHRLSTLGWFSNAASPALLDVRWIADAQHRERGHEGQSQAGHRQGILLWLPGRSQRGNVCDPEFWLLATAGCLSCLPQKAGTHEGRPWNREV